MFQMYWKMYRIVLYMEALNCFFLLRAFFSFIIQKSALQRDGEQQYNGNMEETSR